MKCPKCESTEGNYDDYWDEYLDEDGMEETYNTWYWDCIQCNNRVMSYEEGFEYED